MGTAPDAHVKAGVRTRLQGILTTEDPHATRLSFSFAGLAGDELSRLKEHGLACYEGKVRQCLSRGDEIYLVHTDRLSAFDRPITLVPFKGVALNHINEFWFRTLHGALPTAYRSSDGDRMLVMRKLAPVKAEVIVRGYLAGSMLRAYERGERSFCGETLLHGLTPYGPLDRPIITPTSKAEVYEHDENRTPAELVAEGVCTPAEWEKIAEMSLRLFAIGSQVYREKGWILVDTKYEFGRAPDGSLALIDEVHTPDSSRLWKADSYRERVAAGLAPEMLDKEIIRRYLLQQGFSGKGPVPTVPLSKIIELALVYTEVAECLMGTELMASESAEPLREGLGLRG